MQNLEKLADVNGIGKPARHSGGPPNPQRDRRAHGTTAEPTAQPPRPRGIREPALRPGEPHNKHRALHATPRNLYHERSVCSSRCSFDDFFPLYLQKRYN